MERKILTRLRKADEMAKRCLDILLSLVGLIVASPVFAGVAAAIRLTDGSPVLFRQQRMGWRGVRFTLYKFRTMRVPPNGESSSFDAGNTSRVTRVGSLLRSSKLDELPQLWNVLRGDMSLVGPRPEVEKWAAVYPERWARVLTIRPGITDPASIVYRHEEEILKRAPDPDGMYRQVILPQKLSLYERYVQARTFWGDIQIILQTFAAVLTRHKPKSINGDWP